MIGRPTPARGVRYRLHSRSAALTGWALADVVVVVDVFGLAPAVAYRPLGCLAARTVPLEQWAAMAPEESRW